MPSTVIGDLDALLLNSLEIKSAIDQMHKTLETVNEGIVLFNTPKANPLPEPSVRWVKEDYTFAKLGSTQDVSGLGLSNFGLQVTATGVVGLWDVRLEGSLDGINFTQILNHKETNLSGTTLWTINRFPCLYFRTKCVGINLKDGVKITVTALGVK